MGSGGYNSQTRYSRAVTNGYYTKSRDEIFTERELNKDMDPRNVTLRESRDSEEHPESLAIIIALDVTGSMGIIPQEFIKDGLPLMIDNLIQSGIEHPQVMFVAVGDHYTDRAPFQISQFESNDELLDNWLKKVWLEGSGGGNGGESYSLPYFFAGNFTDIDCWNKRKQKGFIFTIGDEHVHTKLESKAIKNIFGNGDYSDQSIVECIDKAKEKYEVFHISLNRYQENDWKELLGENLIQLEKNQINKIAPTIAETIKSALKINSSETKLKEIEVL